MHVPGSSKEPYLASTSLTHLGMPESHLAMEQPFTSTQRNLTLDVPV